MRSVEPLLVSVEVLREVRELPVLAGALAEVSVLMLDELVLVLGAGEVAAELRDGLLIAPPVVLLVLPLGAVCVLVLGPGVSLADGGRVFLPVSLMAPPEVLGEVVVWA